MAPSLWKRFDEWDVLSSFREVDDESQSREAGEEGISKHDISMLLSDESRTVEDSENKQPFIVIDDEFKAKAKKVGVAVAGGTLLTVGVALFFLPTPVGEIMAASGVAVLAQEFPAARRVVDKSKEGLVTVIDSIPEEEEEENVERPTGEEAPVIDTKRMARSFRRSARKVGMAIRPHLVVAEEEDSSVGKFEIVRPDEETISTLSETSSDSSA